MVFAYNPGGGPGESWRLAYSLVTLANEVAQAYPDAICLGTIGDAAHQAQDTESDHNPFIRDPNTGIGIVRAIDIAGPAATQQALFDHLQAMYEAQDPRLYMYGYLHKDNVITSWPPATGTHIDVGDVGHLHVSVTQVDGYAPSSAGYLSAIDSTAPWGIGGFTLDHSDPDVLELLKMVAAFNLVEQPAGGFPAAFTTMVKQFSDTRNHVLSLPSAAQIATAVVAALPPTSGGSGLTSAQVEDAVVSAMQTLKFGVTP